MKLTKTFLTSALLATSIFSVQSTAQADTPEQKFQQGFEAANKGDYQTALKLLQPLAAQGHAKAQNSLGWMYSEGKGVKQDYAEAIKWYQKAIVQGNAKAQNNLGNMYNDGKGVKQDYAETIKWYQKAAEQDYAKAQFNLGTMYHNGEGVKRDLSKAKEWFRKACDKGNKKACDTLKMQRNHFEIRTLKASFFVENQT